VEKRLILLVGPSGCVGPLKKRLCKRRSVIEASLQFHNGSTGSKTDPVHAFHVQHRIVIAAPYRHGPVVSIVDLRLHGHVSRRAMVLRPVELDPTGSPWTCQPDQRRLDDILTIESRTH
jgi:hypothetical protein